MDYASRITTGRQARPMRNVFYGVEGIGKTTLASLFPAPVTLAAEDGTSHIDTSRIVPTNWDDAIGFMAWLYNTPDHGYQTLNIDTAGWLEQMAATRVCQRKEVDSLGDIGYGAWKPMLMDEFENGLNWLSALYGKGMHINVIAHAAVSKFKNPEADDYDRYTLRMTSQDLAERLKQWADNVVFLNYDTMIDKKNDQVKAVKSFNRRIAHFRRAAAYDAKTRMDFPDTLDLSDNAQAGFDLFWSYYQAWTDSGSKPSTQPEAA